MEELFQFPLIPHLDSREYLEYLRVQNGSTQTIARHKICRYFNVLISVYSFGCVQVMYAWKTMLETAESKTGVPITFLNHNGHMHQVQHFV